VSALRLHIGGREPREGWKILNIQPGPGVDYVGNCIDLSQFLDGSVDELYASHVYEHLSYQGELQRALKEAFRVLAPGGALRVSVPDFATLCQLAIDPKLSVNDRFQVMRMMFGGQLDPHDFHRVGLSGELLAYFLKDAGFSQLRQVDEFKLFEDTSSLRMFGKLISLNVEAKK
jgi:predicted SAM-dependent methyltransferase